MNSLKKYIIPYKKAFILGPFFKLIEAILELIIPLVMANVIDVGIKNKDINYVLKMGIIMLILCVIGLCFSIMCQYYAAKAAGGIGTTLRNAVFSQINSFSYKDIDKFDTSSLITRVTNDINQIQFAINMGIRLVSRSPFLIIGAIFMSMIIDLKVSLIVLITAPIITITVYLIMKTTSPYYAKIQNQLDKLSLISMETLSGIRVIRAFSRGTEYKEKFNNNASALSLIAINTSKISALLQPLTYFTVNTAIIFIIYIGAKRVNVGSLAQGQIIAIVNYMTQIMLSLVVVANLVVIFTKAHASITRIDELLNTPTENNSPDVPNTSEHNVNQNSLKVEFNNVTFSYSNAGENELDNISFSVKKGNIIGIIGGTGSGKSTLINLIPRFYQIKSGIIKIDGKNIENYSLAQLRKKINIVPQNSVLFSGSVRDNLKWANQAVTDQEIHTALKIAHCLGFLKDKLDIQNNKNSEKLSTELDVYVERDGKNFSGGQKQRLTIARAIINNPEILIMDDSLSALDNITQKNLLSDLLNSIDNMTIFIVSQRINTIKNADQIIVLDNGKLISIGKHDELLKMSSLYREIYLSQE